MKAASGSPMPEPLSRSRRRLILTGDDFGLSPGINAAIIQAHREGRLTCASFMAGGPAAGEAAVLAREHPSLCLGLHLTLIQGRAVLPPRHLPHLCDQDGNFRNHPVGTGCYYFFSRAARREILAEAAAQIERLLDWGLQPWFLNGHLNLHLHPAIWPLVVDLARRYQIPAVRLAREELVLNLRLDRRRPGAKTAQALIFAWLSLRALKTGGSLVYNDYLFGLLNDGRITESYLLGLLPHLKPGVTEIYGHPAGTVDAELRRWTPQYQHTQELQALLSPRLQAALERERIEVISYRELVKGSTDHG